MSIKERLDGFEIIDPESRKNVDFETALDKTGFGKYNFFLIIVCGLTLFTVNNEAYSVGYILPSAECDLGLTTYTKGILTSAAFTGTIASCCFWGYISDTKGRKKVLLLTLLASFLCTLASTFTTTFWAFAILRFCNGIFISGPSSVIFVYFGEFQSRKYRSTSMALASLFVAFSLIYLPGVGWNLLPQQIHLEFFGIVLNSWRLFILINGLASLVVCVAFLKLPESPKFLYHSGKISEALEVLRKIYSVNTAKYPCTFPVESLDQKVLLQEAKVDLASQIGPLFRRPHLKYTLCACFMQGAVFAVSSGLLVWYPDIVHQISASGGNNNITLCQALSVGKIAQQQELLQSCTSHTLSDDIFIQNLVIGVAYLFSYVIWGTVVNFLGNRNFIMFCMMISSMALFVINLFPQKIMVDVLFVVGLTIPGICVAVINSVLVEIVPTHLCSMAICICMTAGRLGSIISSTIFGMMVQWNCTLTFISYGLSLVACFLLALVLPRSAKA